MDTRFARAIKTVGLSEVARRLGVPAQVVCNWRLRKQVPVKRCAQVIEALDGKVTKRDLRPADWAEIWPAERAQ